MKKIIVDKEKNLVKLSFNTRFYKEYFIDRAIKDFSHICNIRKENNLIYLEPKTEETRLETIGYEFYNYVLALIKNN